MKLLDLTINNFMPYKGRQKLSFPTDDTANVLVIYGDNMRGKTSLLNAIRWCLYGKALGRHLREIRAKNLINTEALKDGDPTMSVALRFEAKGKEYDLRRALRPKSLIATPKSDSDFAEEVGLRRDGFVLSASEILHEINQICPEQVSRFFLFDGELLQEYESLLLDGAGQGQKIKEKIEQVLGVPALINGRDEIRTLLKKAQKIQAKEMKHVQGLESQAEQLMALQADAEALEQDLEKITTKFEDTKTQIEVIDDALEATEAVQSHIGRMAALESQRTALREQDKGLKSQARVIMRDAWRDLMQPRLQVKLADLEKTRHKIQTTLEDKGRLEAEVANLRTALANPLCPICGEPLSDSRRKALGEQLGRLESQLDSVVGNMSSLSDVAAEIKTLSKINGEGAAKRMTSIEASARRILVDLTKIESELEEIDEKIREFDTAQIARQRAKRDGLTKNLGSLEVDIKKVEQDVEENRRKRDHLSKLMNKNPLARSQRTGKLVEMYSALAELFEVGVDYLRDALRSEVGRRATDTFKTLTTEPTYRGLTISDNYGLTIIDEDGRPVRERSAGAEQIVAVALIDGLNRTARRDRSSSPIIMDTPFGRLDPKHRTNVIRFVPDMAKQVALLVHGGEMSREEDLKLIHRRIGKLCRLERVSASETRIVTE